MSMHGMTMILCTIQKRRRKIQRIFPNAAASIRRYWTVICYRLEALDFNKTKSCFYHSDHAFDPFGKGFYKYTFRMKCEECPNLELQDDATRIFLNCHGTHPEMVSPELIELLHYMEKSTNEVAGSCTSQKIKLLHQKVCQIRSNKENGGEIHARMGRKEK